MNKYLKIVFLLIAFLFLFLIRGFSKELFYDPLIVYFKNDYLYGNIPEIDSLRLIKDMCFRYFLNSIISIAIIWLLFLRKDYVKFTVYFYAIAFVMLITTFAFLLKDQFESGYLLPFYIRRFIIHPLFLLILLPAFYFQKLSNK